MRGRVPRPLLAALGAATEVRRVPGLLVQLPLLTLTGYDRARRTYDELALRGEDVVAGALGPEADRAPDPASAPAQVRAALDPVAEAVAHVADPMDHPQPPPRPDLPEPIPGYDAMTLGAVRGHLRSLTVADLGRTLAYERAFLARTPMVTLLEHRLAKLVTEQGPA